MKRPALPDRPVPADVQHSLARLGRIARRETVPPLDVAAQVLAALGRRRTTALVVTLADEGAAPLGWLAAASLAAAAAVALFALPALEGLSGPLVEFYGLLSGGAL